MAPHHGHAQPAETAPPPPHRRLKASGGPAVRLKRQPTASAPPPAPRRTPRTYATAWTRCDSELHVARHGSALPLSAVAVAQLRRTKAACAVPASGIENM